MKHDACPTCGTKLGPLANHDLVRRCDSCRRPNPRGFNYCGFCAAPMEDPEMQAALSRMAAPPGGWPSLARELVEVRFFIERGELSEAFEMVQVLRQRFPGHPELLDFADLTPTSRPKKVHTQVNQVVDAVLADSADWVGKTVRRAAPRWQAPASEGSDGATQSHTALRRDEVDEDAKTLAPPGGGVNKRVHTDADDGDPRVTRKGHQVVGAFPVIPVINPAFRDAAEAEATGPSGMTGRQPIVDLPPTRPKFVAPPPAVGKKAVKRKSGKQRVAKPDDTGVHRKVRSTGKSKVAQAGRKVTAKQNVAPQMPAGAPSATSGMVEARDDSGRVIEKPERTIINQPQWGTPRGHTMAVDALQPAMPYGEPDIDEELDTVPQRSDDDADTQQARGDGKGKGKGRKRGRGVPKKERTKSGDDSPESEERRDAKARRRAAKFGQNIVGR